MRAVPLLVALVLLSGCTVSVSKSDSSTTAPSDTSSAPADGSDTPTTTTGTTGGPPPSTTAAPGTNQAPVANLTAPVLQGVAPFAVTFSVNATDADGDAIAYNLTFGDGTPPSLGDFAALFEVAHTFAAAGTYEVVLNVSDGAAFGLDSLTVIVEAAAPSEPVVFTGMVVGPDPTPNITSECFAALMTLFFGFPGNDRGLGDHRSFGGQVLDNYAVTMTPAGMHWQFVAGTGYNGDAATGSVPPGSTGVLICSSTAVNANYALTLTPP